MRKRFVLNGLAMPGAAGMPAFAQDTHGFYAGAGIGQATVKGYAPIDFDATGPFTF